MVMEVSLRNCFSYVRNSFADTEKGSIIAISGEKGHGKGELISILESEAIAMGITVFRASALPGPEVIRFHVFNELLNRMSGEVDSRSTTEIISSFERFLSKNSRVIILIENIGNFSQPCRDLFFYFCDLALKFKSIVVSTISGGSNASQSDHAFVNELFNDSRINGIKLLKPSDDDVFFIFNKQGYHLPEDFLKDIYRMTDNISMVKYSIFYYEEIGLIGKDKMINDALYRFTPIPPTVEAHFQSIFNALSETELLIADLVFLSGQMVGLDLIGHVLGFQREVLEKAVKRLARIGVMKLSGNLVSFGSFQFRNFYAEQRKGGDYSGLVRRIGEMNAIESLPIITRLNLFLESGQVDQIGKLITEKREVLLERLYSPETLLGLLNRIRPMMHDPVAGKICDMLTCQCYYEMGYSGEAQKCYEEGNFEDIDPVTPKINLARIYDNAGDSKKASSVLDELLSRLNLTVRERVTALNAKAVVYIHERDYGKAESTVSEALTLSDSDELRDQYSIALSAKGTVLVNLGNYVDAMDFYTRSYEMTEKLGLKSQSIRNLNSMAVLHDYYGDYEKAISLYKEVVDTSYLIGDMRIRAYSIYNIMELADLIGKYSMFDSYVYTEKNLLRVIREPYISYRFHRFLSKHYSEFFEYEKAMEEADESLGIATEIGDRQWIDMSRGLKAQLELLSGRTVSQELMSLLDREFESIDDFIPFYYLNSIIYFISRDDSERLSRVTRIMKEHSEKSHDYYSRLSYLVVQAVYYFNVRNLAELRKLVDENQSFLSDTPTATALFSSYSYVVDIFEGRTKEAEETMKQLMIRLETISPLYSIVSRLIMSLGKTRALKLSKEQVDLTFLDTPGIPAIMKKLGELILAQE